MIRWIAPVCVLACSSGPFEEINELGLNQYLGQVTPSDISTEEDRTTYSFDVEDGPICLRGDPFNTTTRLGSSNDLLIFLQGGGACWSGMCQAFTTVRAGVPNTGILNRSLSVNPVADWNVGYIPYCDGSLFAGDVDIDDDGDGKVDRYHRGLLNLSASLDAIHSQFPSPDRVLIVGSSAGAYGTILGAMLTRSIYPKVPIDVVADGGVGLGLPGEPWFIEFMLDEWGISKLVPESCEGCFDDGHVTGMTSWALDRDDEMSMYAITSVQDFIIADMFLGIGGTAYETAVRDETEEMSKRHPNQYHRFVFAGSKHTTVSIDSTVDFSSMEGLPFDFDPEMLAVLLGTFDETEVNGVAVARWLSMGLNGEPEFMNQVYE